jgi:hypothetical protein
VLSLIKAGEAAWGMTGMDSLSGRRKFAWLYLTAILLVLSAGLVVSADALARAITAVAPSGDSHWWGLREAEPRPLGSAVPASWAGTAVSLQLRLTGDQARAQYSLTVPSHSKLIAQLLSYAATAGSNSLAVNFLGMVQMSDSPYEFGRTHYWHQLVFNRPYVKQVAQQTTIVLPSKVYYFNINPKFIKVEDPVYIGRGFSRSIVFQGATSQVGNVSGASISQLSSSAESLQTVGGRGIVSFSVEGPAVDWLDGVRSVGATTFAAAPANLLYRLVRYLSYLVLLGALYRLAMAYPRNDAARIARDAVGAITAAMVTIALLGFAYNITQEFFPPGHHNSYYLAGPAGLLLAAALTVWPVVLFRIGRRPPAWAGPQGPEPRMLLPAITGGVAAGGAALIFTFLLHDLFDVPISSIAVPVAACWLVGTTVISILAVLKQWPRWTVTLVAPLSVAAVLFSAQLAPVLYYGGSYIATDPGRVHVNVIGKWLYLVLPVAILLALVVAAVKMIRKSVYGRWRWWLSVAASGAIAAAILPDAISDSQVLSGHHAGEAPVYFFAGNSLIEALPALMSWLFVGLAIGALCSIRESADKRMEIRGVGVAMLLVLLFRVSSSWIYLPVSVVLGYVAIRYVVMPARLAEKRAGRMTPPQAIHYALSAWRRAELADNQRQQLTSNSADALRDVLVKDGPDHYGRSFDAMVQAQRDLDQRYDRWQNLARDAAGVAFAHRGNLPSKKMARQGLFVGLIWTLVSGAIQLLASAPVSPSTSYPGLDFFGGNGELLFIWPLLGWCVGYFLPFIRGKDGVEKALWFSLPVIAAAVPLQLLWDDTTGWLNVLVYDLELFSFLMVSAVIVSDLLVLRAAGMRLKTWVQVHNWRFVVSWSSAVLAALVTAAATFLSTTATTVTQQTFTSGTTQSTGAPTTSGHR